MSCETGVREECEPVISCARNERKELMVRCERQDNEGGRGRGREPAGSTAILKQILMHGENVTQNYATVFSSKRGALNSALAPMYVRVPCVCKPLIANVAPHT
jgi:hypothetical protein